MDLHPESALQMPIPDADADPATKFELLLRSSILCAQNLNFLTFCYFSKIGLLYRDSPAGI
jgi:hypothetical protein